MVAQIVSIAPGTHRDPAVSSPNAHAFGRLLQFHNRSYMGQISNLESVRIGWHCLQTVSQSGRLLKVDGELSRRSSVLHQSIPLWNLSLHELHELENANRKLNIAMWILHSLRPSNARTV